MTEWIQSLQMPWRLIAWVVLAGLVVLAAWCATRLNHLAFRRMQKRQRGLHLDFFEKVCSLGIVVVIVIIVISALNGARSVWHTMLGGTAVISAVLAFAAQDVIRDVLAGLMISVNKPFEIGDRIVLDNGTTGVVESITMRHVILHGADTIRYIIPNSKINAQQVTNFGYEQELQSAEFTFHVGYSSDMALVKRVIAQTVENSKLTRPGLFQDGVWRYAPVYFSAFSASSLVMQVLVYFEKQSSPALVTDEINSAVREALLANGIEIPYSYVNVIPAGGGKPLAET